jgi:uncharacterized membrane-anchored protein YhcB (DUF1043 family)
MTLWQALSLFGTVVGIGLVLFLIRLAWVRSRQLNRRIESFKAEMEERQKQGIPFNPYLELAQLYEEEETEHVASKKRRKN